MLTAGGKTSDAGSFGMKDGGADTDKRGRRKEQPEGRRDGEQQEAGKGEDHADRERERHGPTVGIVADERLQERGEHLVGHRDQSNLAEIKAKRTFQNWVHGGQQ